MGTLRELTSGKNVHLLITNSNLAEIYVYDELKRICGAGVDSVYDISSKGTFNEMLEYVGIQPYLADMWLFVIRYKSVKSLVKQHTAIFESETSKFLVCVDTYKDYLEFKKIVPSVNDLYLSSIRGNDIMYLLNGFEISQKAINFVSMSYGRDPDKVFMLREHLMNGYKVETQKDIVKICGTGSGTIDYMVLLLLSGVYKTDSGKSKALRKRISVFTGLLDTYGVSSTRNFLIASSRDFLYIKELYLSGAIYKSIRDLPECFDEKQLSRHSMYFNKIKDEFSYERILKLHIELRDSGYWRNRSDALSFLYSYCMEVI